LAILPNSPWSRARVLHIGSYLQPRHRELKCDFTFSRGEATIFGRVLKKSVSKGGDKRTSGTDAISPRDGGFS